MHPPRSAWRIDKTSACFIALYLIGIVARKSKPGVPPHRLDETRRNPASSVRSERLRTSTQHRSRERARTVSGRARTSMSFQCFPGLLVNAAAHQLRPPRNGSALSVQNFSLENHGGESSCAGKPRESGFASQGTWPRHCQLCGQTHPINHHRIEVQYLGLFSLPGHIRQAVCLNLNR